MDDKKFQSLSKSQQELVIKIATEAERQGVKPELALAVAEAETGGGFSHYRGDKVLTSPAGARGVMQIMPDTARLYNKKYGIDINPDDEDSNIMGGVTILKDLLTTYKSPRNAVALYNASPKAVAQFMKLYETDPDKAILSLPNETRNYSLRISKNFNLDDDKETGLIGSQAEPAKEPSRYESYESEATKLRKEQEAKDEEARLNPPPPKPKTLLDSAIESANKIDPEYAALIGAGANAILPAFTDPKVTPKIDTGKAQEANLTAQDKLELARRNLENAVPQGTENLEDTFRQSQGELERLRNEQRLAQERLKGIPKSPPIVEPPAPSSPFPQVTREGRASGPKVEGDSGTRNWMIQEAGQQHQLPEVILDAATGKSKDSPTGGKALIDQDLANLETKKRLGFADYGLITLPSGVQLDLPPTTVAERQADIDKQNQASQAELESRTEQTRIQQETQARLLEQQRALYEYEMERLRQERAQAGQRHNIITGQTKAAAPLQRALTKAETDAEIARRKLARAQQQPNAAGRVLERAGVATTGPAKAGALPRAFTGAGATYLGVMSYQEALQRFNAGDTSEGVLKALQAGSAAAAMLPPVGKTMTKARGAGALGMAGTYGYEGVRRLLKDRPPE
jgi:TolA-binding protein